MLKFKYEDDNVRFLALLFHGEFQERIKYDSETGEFYVFSKKWEIDHDFTCISSFMMREFVNFFNEDLSTLEEIVMDMEPDNPLYGHMKQAIERLCTLKEMCSSGLSTPSLKMAFRTLLKENGFGKTVDSNRNLIGFNNGVYDLETSEFRPFNINDVVTMSTGYDFQLEQNTSRK